MEELNKLTPFEKMIVRRVKKMEVELNRVSSWQQWSKNMQQKFDGLIPQKVHRSLAYALEKGVKGFLQGLNLLAKKEIITTSQDVHSLEELTEEAQKIVQRYKKMALVEGAGTGFGGLLSSAIDFPLLLSIKLKLLQELALLFGYRLSNFEERVYILKIFQLQFSGREYKQKVWKDLKHWEKQKYLIPWQSWETFNWDDFYMEYKQSIEWRKLLQIIPGFGAIVGAWANHSFLDDLGRTAILCLQWRRLEEKYNL